MSRDSSPKRSVDFVDRLVQWYESYLSDGNLLPPVSVDLGQTCESRDKLISTIKAIKFCNLPGCDIQGSVLLAIQAIGKVTEISRLTYHGNSPAEIVFNERISISHMGFSTLGVDFQADPTKSSVEQAREFVQVLATLAVAQNYSGQIGPALDRCQSSFTRVPKAMNKTFKLAISAIERQCQCEIVQINKLTDVVVYKIQ